MKTKIEPDGRKKNECKTNGRRERRGDAGL